MLHVVKLDDGVFIRDAEINAQARVDIRGASGIVCDFPASREFNRQFFDSGNFNRLVNEIKRECPEVKNVRTQF